MTDKNQESGKTLVFPSNLASEAANGHNHVRLEIHELQNGARINPYIIHLYPPIGFAVTDAGNYGTMDKGAMGAGMNAILTGIGVKSGEDTGITGADLKAGAAMNTSLLGGIPGLDLIDRGARIQAMEAGIAQNPFTHVTYEGHQLRSFSMEFKMISESSAEAKTIAEIIDVIRNYSLPESTGALSIQYPAHFEIQFFQGEDPNPFMPKITTCHLTSLGTTYNSTSNIFHADGAPVETDVSLQFQEIKTLTRQDLYGEAFEGLDDKYEVAEVSGTEGDAVAGTEDNTTTSPPTE